MGWGWKNYPMDEGRCSNTQAPHSQARGLRYARSAVCVGFRAIKGPMLTPTFVSLFSLWPKGETATRQNANNTKALQAQTHPKGL